jgi:hypothetical protein
MDFDLSGFKPEPLSEDSDFKPFSGKYDVVVDEAIKEDMPAGERDGEPYEAYTRIKVKMTTIKAYKPADSVNIGRSLFRSFNVSNLESVKKMASVYASVGIEFVNEAQLNENYTKIVGKTLSVSCWVGKEDKRQAFKFIRSDAVNVGTENTPF